jgi:hypothetical protein
LLGKAASTAQGTQWSEKPESVLQIPSVISFSSILHPIFCASHHSLVGFFIQSEEFQKSP